MRTLLYILIFIILSITFSFKPYTFRTYFSGKVYSDDINIKKEIVGLHLFVKANNQIIGDTYIEQDGKYNIDFLPEDEKTDDFFITGAGIDTIFLKSYAFFESEVMTWDIKLPNAYQKKLGQVVCPKCNHSDKVYPIIYGDSQIGERILNGDTTYTRIVNNKYYAGTCISNSLSPKWYCDRDKIKF